MIEPNRIYKELIENCEKDGNAQWLLKACGNDRVDYDDFMEVHDYIRRRYTGQMAAHIYNAELRDYSGYYGFIMIGNIFWGT